MIVENTFIASLRRRKVKGSVLAVGKQEKFLNWCIFRTFRGEILHYSFFFPFHGCFNFDKPELNRCLKYLSKLFNSKSSLKCSSNAHASITLLFIFFLLLFSFQKVKSKYKEAEACLRSTEAGRG